jgi:hypothetical protein
MTEDWGTNAGWLVFTLFICWYVARAVVGYIGLTGWLAFFVGLVFVGAPIFIGSMYLYNRIFLKDEQSREADESI